jgi:hypothetical protein
VVSILTFYIDLVKLFFLVSCSKFCNYLNFPELCVRNSESGENFMEKSAETVRPVTGPLSGEFEVHRRDYQGLA